MEDRRFIVKNSSKTVKKSINKAEEIRYSDIEEDVLSSKEKQKMQ